MRGRKGGREGGGAAGMERRAILKGERGEGEGRQRIERRKRQTCPGGCLSWNLRGESTVMYEREGTRGREGRE